MTMMRKFRALTATFLLAAACLLVVPAMAGPQNGEVNHARADTQSVSVEGPSIEICGPLAYFRGLLMLIPLDWLVPGWGDHSTH